MIILLQQAVRFTHIKAFLALSEPFIYTNDFLQPIYATVQNGRGNYNSTTGTFSSGTSLRSITQTRLAAVSNEIIWSVPALSTFSTIMLAEMQVQSK